MMIHDGQLVTIKVMPSIGKNHPTLSYSAEALGRVLVIIEDLVKYHFAKNDTFFKDLETARTIREFYNQFNVKFYTDLKYIREFFDIKKEGFANKLGGAKSIYKFTHYIDKFHKQIISTEGFGRLMN